VITLFLDGLGTMAAMAMTAPVGGVTRVGASSRSASRARRFGTLSYLTSSALKGQKMNFRVNVVRRAEKTGGLQVVMTAILPPQQTK